MHSIATVVSRFATAITNDSQVPMGPTALRDFVAELDATLTDHPQQYLPIDVVARESSTTPSTREASKNRRTATGRYGSTQVNPRRILLERRLEAANMLSRPFALRLEVDGVSNVKMLARVPLRAWDLPPCLVEEVERMLGLLVAKTCAVEHSRAHRGRREKCSGGLPAGTVQGLKSTGGRRVGATTGSGGREGKNSKGGACTRGVLISTRCSGSKLRSQRSSLPFDPRFQRSAVDPFGRPPRLERIQPCPGLREGRQRSDDYVSDAEEDLPPGPWDRPQAEEDESDAVGKDNDAGDGKLGIKVEEAAITARCANATVDSGHGLSPSVATTYPAGGSYTAKSGFADRKVVLCPPHPGEPGGDRAPLDRRRRRTPAHKPAGKTSTITSANLAGKRGGKKQNSVSDRERPTTMMGKKSDGIASPSFICQVPGCDATFSRTCTLRIHHRSHFDFPVYHSVRRALQLFRDRPPASLETGDGAIAARFLLRTELPASVRRELCQLQEESVTRRHRGQISKACGPRRRSQESLWRGGAQEKNC